MFSKEQKVRESRQMGMFHATQQKDTGKFNGWIHKMYYRILSVTQPSDADDTR